MSIDPEVTPLRPPEAKALARRIANVGTIKFSGHAREEMSKDGLDASDCRNLVRAGVFEPAELENGEWRYRVRTARMCIVVAFRSVDHLTVITAWRVRP
ncbi:MAG: DUF4258 domain-containing protein [Gemmatimonadetes bacterium]|nr:DUF4258 domain-containing protein [Gemmatimonadota bacterium]